MRHALLAGLYAGSALGAFAALFFGVILLSQAPFTTEGLACLSAGVALVTIAALTGAALDSKQ